MKQLTKEQIFAMHDKNPKAAWFEGMTEEQCRLLKKQLEKDEPIIKVVGYWKEGDSYVFKNIINQDMYIVTKPYMTYINTLK